MLQKLPFTTAYNRHGEQKLMVADHIKANDNKRSGLEKGERGVILGGLS